MQKTYNKLKRRVARLGKFLDLNAPAVVIKTELGLVNSAYEEYLKEVEETSKQIALGVN